MVWYQIEARDGLVLRDGRPNTGRSESQTIDFPHPSTIVGGVRTALGTLKGAPFDLGAKDAVLKAQLRGPLLAEANGGTVFVRAPYDALFVSDEWGNRHLRALRPIQGVVDTDLGEASGIKLVGLPAQEIVSGKPPKDLPRYWSWQALTEWLARPLDRRSGNDGLMFVSDGLTGLSQERRMHVSLDPDTETAIDGQLFGTSALRLVGGKKANQGFPVELSLLIDVDTSEVDARWRTLHDGTRPLGGKRKLVHWTKLSTAPKVDQVPPAVLDSVSLGADSVVVRVVLLTPAHFENGALPTWLLEPRHGVTVCLEAACVGRPETTSGWDFDRQCPKASRRLVSAGSVYWLELSGEPAARKRWVEEMWMINVSDGEQERRDGFGLAVVGVGS